VGPVGMHARLASPSLASWPHPLWQLDASILKWLLLYPGVLLTRGLAILLLFPLLKRLGLGCDWRTAVVMWWGGLRGSVGLALALMVHHTMYSSRTWGGPEELQEDGTLPCRDIPRDTVRLAGSNAARGGIGRGGRRIVRRTWWHRRRHAEAPRSLAAPCNSSLPTASSCC